MKEVFDYIVSLLKSRIFPMILVFIVLISVLVHRLFVLQIIKGDSYVEDLSSSIQKDIREKQDLVWATLNSWRVLGCVSDLDILYWH